MTSRPVQRHQRSARVSGVRDLGRVAAMAQNVAGQVETAASMRHIPLVLGGDCTVTLGVVAGLSRLGPVGLLYFDGDADLNTSPLSGSGVLDTMGITHLLGGGAPALAAVVNTEVNPDHHPEGTVLDELGDVLATALA